MAAQALAGELGIPMLYVRFDALISSYLGETASNIRKVFDATVEYNHDVKETNNDLRESITKRFSDTLLNNGINNANENRIAHIK